MYNIRNSTPFLNFSDRIQSCIYGSNVSTSLWSVKLHRLLSANYEKNSNNMIQKITFLYPYKK